jgi:hypothetical protein
MSKRQIKNASLIESKLGKIWNELKDEEFRKLSVKDPFLETTC